MAIQNIEAGTTSLNTPNADDDIVILGGSAIITGNVDWSGVTGADTVRIALGFNGSLGTSSAPFKCQVEEFFVYGPSGGECYWESEDSGGAAASLQLIQPIGSSGTMRFNGTGTLTSAEVAGGTLIVATTAVVTNLYMGFGANVHIFDDSSTDPTLIRNNGGILHLDRGATTIFHGGGTTVLQGENANAVTTLNVDAQGLQIVDSGTITTLNAFGGIPNINKLARSLTISNTNINMSLPGAEAFLQDNRITHSSITKYLGE